jgi:hypothetical protein
MKIELSGDKIRRFASNKIRIVAAIICLLHIAAYIMHEYYNLEQRILVPLYIIIAALTIYFAKTLRDRYRQILQHDRVPLSCKSGPKGRLITKIILLCSGLGGHGDILTC